jgi:hypothetical protein
MKIIHDFFKNKTIAKIIFSQKTSILNKKKELTNYVNGYNNKITIPPLIISQYPKIYLDNLPKIFGNIEQKYYVVFNGYKIYEFNKQSALLMPRSIEIYDGHEIIDFKSDLIKSGMDINFIDNSSLPRLLEKGNSYICVSHVISITKTSVLD